MNIQPIEKRDLRNDGVLAVHGIFQTIQGEGPFCGVPCVFVRLAGCNLQCPACDTDYTSKRTFMTPEHILGEVANLSVADMHGNALVVVTGGEPFRQDLFGLFATLVGAGYYVQVESNGTLEPTLPVNAHTAGWHYSRNPERKEGVYVVCSPKTGKIHPTTFDVASALKYVVRAGCTHPEDGLPLSALDHPSNPYPARPPKRWNRPVYVQPLDEKHEGLNEAHAREAVASCLKYGYTLQIQVHKLVGVE